jgi:hypothetical protein
MPNIPILINNVIDHVNACVNNATPKTPAKISSDKINATNFLLLKLFIFNLL